MGIDAHGHPVVGGQWNTLVRSGLERLRCRPHKSTPAELDETVSEACLNYGMIIVLLLVGNYYEI